MEAKKIAVIHPWLMQAGGSESRALWIAEALKDDYKVSLVSMGEIDLDELNKYYGTCLDQTEVENIKIPVPRWAKKKFDALRSYRVFRYCKANSDQFDLMISTYNVMDFGKKGIQFIADFSFDDDLRRKYDSKKEKADKLVYKKSLFRALYINLSKWLSNMSINGWKKNITIANSEWSAGVIKKKYGIDAEVIYPPVSDGFFDVKWEGKDNGFTAIGRLVPEKGFDKIVFILKKLREKDHNIHLHIIGDHSDISYYKRLKRIEIENSSWCFLEGPKYGEEKKKMISRHKYGISGCRNEAFGIAVAEMVKAGNIVWVSDGGGQVEIVDHSLLVYENEEDAINKILKVIGNVELQHQLRVHLKNNSSKFSSDNFCKEVRELTQEFFNK